MPLYTTTDYGFRIDFDYDQDDGEPILIFHTPRGPVSIDVHPSWQDIIERSFGDDEDIEMVCRDAINFAMQDIEACYPGETFSHFADAPDDNSMIVTRQRTAREISDARNSMTYRDLANAGLSDKDIQKLAQR